MEVIPIPSRLSVKDCVAKCARYDIGKVKDYQFLRFWILDLDSDLVSVSSSLDSDLVSVPSVLILDLVSVLCFCVFLDVKFQQLFLDIGLVLDSVLMKASDDLFLGIHKFCTFWKFDYWDRYFSSYDSDFLFFLNSVQHFNSCDRFDTSFFLGFGSCDLGFLIF
ncbi:hypothetical protein RCL_jg10153.t2 [Rhizophagus clarus]|uniref:Uncharacterized protein n=1 Tax=Rhizophagus clarus TaxID=94130 RepID=A0A8H3KRM1_9GLOM|nr:hypothetical protein RCL_jg10153.t2 [Rhizophagus clarus]